jgi:hypothetical protein
MLIERAARPVVEQLEERRLLTTAIGGMFGEFDSQGHFFPESDTFEYREQDGDRIRIKLSGDIDVEFIGMQLGKGSDQNGFIDTTKKLVDLVPAFVGQTPEQSTDLFEIYIAASAPDATISIAKVVDPPAVPRPMLPFDGDSGPIRINNAFTGVSQTVTSGQGSVYIGARTLDTISGTSLEQDIPILSVKRRTAFGLRPAPFNGRLGAGIITAPGVNTGKILIGGTVTGNVDIAGSIDTFYAGSILTGDATGLDIASAPNINDNFHIGGDIRALYSGGGIGTVSNSANVAEPVYNTGFDMEVGGKLGMIYSVGDDVMGSIHVRNDTKGWSTPQREVEFKSAPFSTSGPGTYFEDLGEIGGRSFNDAFANDSFQTAQYLNTWDSKTLGQKNIAVVNGELNTATNVNDDDDYYGVALMAGQRVNVQLSKRDEATGKTIGPSTNMHVGVFDPDGRLIASDYSFVNQTTNTGTKDPAQGSAIEFVADRPGVYRFAVATNGDTTFTAHNSTNVIGVPYQLQIKNAGAISLGGVVAVGNIYTQQTRVRFSPTAGRSFATEDLHAIDVDTGDLGAIAAGAHSYLGGDTPARIDAGGQIVAGGTAGRLLQYSDVPIAAVTGNIRSIEADNFGYGPEIVGLPFNENPRFGINLYAHSGSVGLLRTWDTGGTAFINDAFIDPVSDIGNPKKAIGGDYQLIDIAGTLSGTLIANRAIGVIRAATIAPGKSYIVNADNKGNDGVIDLIDASGDIGDNSGGGPAIVTGPGGNVRYMHAGGNVFRDRSFGGGTPEETDYDFGEVANLRDDSGAAVQITPTPNVPIFGQPTFDNPGRLRITTYPIRGDLTGGASAGSVIVKIVAEGSAGGVSRGVEIKTGNSGGSVEIGSLEVASNGVGTFFDPALKTFGATNTTNPVDVNLEGAGRIDIFDLSGLDDGVATLDTLVNSSPGEIVNTNLASVAEISVETLGVAKSTTGTEVSGVDNSTAAVGSTYPFLQQRNFASLDGDVASLHTRQGMGNVVLGGNVGSLEANSNNRNISGVFEGFNAPITVGGELVEANIGEGIPGVGTGSFAHAGLFATGAIDSVVNQGRGSDIRGVVLSTNSIESIRMGDGGSLIGAQVLVATTYDSARAFGGIVLPATGGSFNNPDFQLGALKLTGPGGIIGSRIVAANLGPITVAPGGFGILNSLIAVGGPGRISEVSADGYGIRNTLIGGGAGTGKIAATGHGQQLDANKFTPSVRGSAFGQFDALSGYENSFINDLYKTLGVTPQKTKRGSISKAGVISDTIINGSRTLDSVSAWGIQARTIPSVVDPNDSTKRITVDNTNTLYPMQIQFGDQIGSINVTNQILGLALSGGAINAITVGDDVYEARIASSGRIKNVAVGGTFRGSSALLANGINGQIDSFSVGRSLFGQVSSLNNIGTVSVGRDVGSTLFNASGNINQLNIGNDVLDGANIQSKKTIGSLAIGDDLNAGAVIKAKALGAFTIGGDQAGTLAIG